MITNLSHNAVICIRSSTAKHLGVRSGTERTGQGHNFELIPAIKMETRHPVKIYFPRVFPAICYHCEVLAAWSRHKLKIFENCCVFWRKKRPLIINFQNSVRKVYIATLIDVVLCEIRANCPRHNRWNRALFTWPKNEQKFQVPSHTGATLASPNIWLTTFQISYKSIHFRRSYSRPRDGRSLGALCKSNTSAKRWVIITVDETWVL